MGLLSNIGNWFKHFFNTVKTDLETFASHAWTLLEPFIQAFFTEAEKEIIATLQTLALTAIQQVASQGCLQIKLNRMPLLKLCQMR